MLEVSQSREIKRQAELSSNYIMESAYISSLVLIQVTQQERMGQVFDQKRCHDYTENYWTNLYFSMSVGAQCSAYRPWHDTHIILVSRSIVQDIIRCHQSLTETWLSCHYEVNS